MTVTKYYNWLLISLRHSSRAVTVLPVVDRSTEDDLAPVDVFTVATRVTIRRTAHFASNSLLQRPVGFLAARVVVATTVQLHFRVHRGHLTPANRALCCHPDHCLGSVHPSFSLSISISTALRHWGTRVTHRPPRHLPGVRNPTVIRPQVPG